MKLLFLLYNQETSLLVRAINSVLYLLKKHWIRHEMNTFVIRQQSLLTESIRYTPLALTQATLLTDIEEYLNNVFSFKQVNEKI